MRIIFYSIYKHLAFIVILSLFIPVAKAQDAAVTFTSSDKKVEQAFEWAKGMALHYKGHPADPVGAWYESALPPRDAFCMRDVSHQSIGAEVLGLNRENYNMLSLFAGNISASKNWCSYWEINKKGDPAPEDYRNDKEFWYNLPANFDVLYATWKLYLWTGDKRYINTPVFIKFQEKTVNEYIDQWVLSADSILIRPAHPNAPVPYNESDSFHRCRGLPSYSEGVPNLKAGADLVAALYRGLLTYSAIMAEKGKKSEAALYAQKAKKYRQQLEAKWWDDKDKRYYTYYSNNGYFGKDEGEAFLLWFDALKDNGRVKHTLDHLTSKIWNVENTSYLPLVFYNHRSWDKGRDYLLYLSDKTTPRREYPEVSFGVIEGIVQGLMGIAPDARTVSISTIYKSSSKDSAAINNLPVLGTVVDISHLNDHQSAMNNKGVKQLKWKAMFNGNFLRAYVNRHVVAIKTTTDPQGNTLSFVETTVGPKQQVKISMER